MNESIKDYIEKNYTPEMQTVIFKMLGLLERLNIGSFESYFLNRLSEIDNQDTEFLSMEFVNYLDGFLYNLQKEFGFVLSDDTTFEQRVEFVKAYVALEDYIDHEAVIRITETDNNDSEKLAEAVSLTIELTNGEGQPMSADALLGFIEYVDEAAIYTLQQLHLSETPVNDLLDEIELPEASVEHINQVKAFKLYVQSLNLQIESFEMIRSGYQIGLPFTVYWNAKKDALLEAEHTTYVLEVLALIMFSKEYWSNPLIKFNELTDSNFDDIKVIMEVNNSARGILSGFFKFKSENRIK